eukprot:g28724.t1
MVTAGKVMGVAAVGVGASLCGSQQLRDDVHRVLLKANDAFEDKSSNMWIYLSARTATLQYPEHIPTLVLDVDKVILHLQHDSKKGWQVIKRPFADKFFKEIPHYYEVVLFSDDVFPVALDIASKWNIPVTGVLHRDFCKKKRNHFVKETKLDRVLMIDHDPVAFELQPENGILIRPFDGDPSDTELADLLEFLKAAASTPMDLRKFVQKYGGGDEDVGRRYLLERQEQGKLIEKKRVLGRAIGARSGFAQPGQPVTKPSEKKNALAEKQKAREEERAKLKERTAAYEKERDITQASRVDFGVLDFQSPSRSTQKVLQLLRLKQLHNGVFLKVNKPILNMLKLVQPYVTYGYPSLKTVRELIYKRGFGKQRIPLSSNDIISDALGKHGIHGMEDIIHEIYTVGPNFKQVSNFLWPFKLSSPKGGFVNKRHGFCEARGGDWGNREDWGFTEEDKGKNNP